MKEIFLSILMIFLLSNLVYAQSELPDPGTLPDSAFYGFKRMFEGFGNVFTFGELAKTRRVLRLAERRLAEAEAMAISAKKMYDTDYAISTTGIAGPTKGDANEDVGTVFIGIASPQGVLTEKFNFGKDRQRVITNAANKGFELLRKEILKN